ncbi:MAG: hypothetical protein AAGA23_04590 [Pseudomonadota bacterium]
MIAESATSKLIEQAAEAAKAVHGMPFFSVFEGELMAPLRCFREASLASMAAVVAYSEWLEACGNRFNIVSRAGLNPVRPKKELRTVCEELTARVLAYVEAAEEAARTTETGVRRMLLGRAPAEELPPGPTAKGLQAVLASTELEYVKSLRRAWNQYELLDASPRERQQSDLSIASFPRGETVWPPKTVNKFVGYEWEMQLQRYAQLFQAVLDELAVRARAQHPA